MKHNYLIVAICVITISNAAAAAAADTTNTSISSFFLDLNQMDRYGKTYRIKRLEQICKDKEKHNLVLIKVFNSNGSINNDALDQIQPYYKCFNKIFFSVESKKWNNNYKNWKDTKYYNGIMNKDFINDNIKYSLLNAQKIINKYPDMNLNWYIDYEANLNYFKSEKIRDSYEYYLKNLSNSLYKIRSTDILWSPAFWTPNNELSNNEKIKLTQNLNYLFKNIPKITWIHFQDFLGQSTFVNCERDFCQTNTFSNHNFKNQEEACLNTKENYQILKNAIEGTNIQSLKVNMELFVSVNKKKNIYLPIGNKLLMERKSCYSKNNIPIGISFELMYMPNKI